MLQSACLLTHSYQRLLYPLLSTCITVHRVYSRLTGDYRDRTLPASVVQLRWTHYTKRGKHSILVFSPKTSILLLFLAEYRIFLILSLRQFPNSPFTAGIDLSEFLIPFSYFAAALHPAPRWPTTFTTPAPLLPQTQIA